MFCLFLEYDFFITVVTHKVAIGRREQISVYGDDYKTRDGTGDRDYVHVMDLAEGHVKVLFEFVIPLSSL